MRPVRLRRKSETRHSHRERAPLVTNGDYKTNKEKTKMKSILRRLHKEEEGQDLIEYALVALIVALGAIVGMGALASSINNEFSKISGSLT